MCDKLFSKDELYDLVNAQRSAMQLERETGIGSGWYEFAQEDLYGKRIDEIEKGGGDFELLLAETAGDVELEFDELSELDFQDFENEEEFYLSRKEIQERIMDMILENLFDYWNQG